MANKEAQNAQFADLYAKAEAAGMAALVACKPRPMVVQRHVSEFDDNSPVAEQWFVPDGVCGFAWVKVRPATSTFARWLKEHKGWEKAYHGGIDMWVHHGDQSMARKEAYANAFAAVLQAAGINAIAGSRID
jgi:hypothetical protein